MLGVYKNVVLFICLCFNLNYIVSGAYFSMINIELNLPVDRSRYPPENRALVTMNALPEKQENDARLLRYSLTENPDKYFQIFHDTGDLMFTQKFFNETLKVVSNISTNIGVKVDGNIKEITKFQVNFLPFENLDCNQMLSDLCYWKSVDYRIYENRRASFIGSLSSQYLLDICQGFHINYTLTKGGDQIEIVEPTKLNPSWMLRTKNSLERDVIKTIKSVRQSYELSGELVQFAVSCSITNNSGTKKEISRNFTLRVLDENDNLPESQDIGDIYVKLKSNFTIKGERVNLKHIGSHKDLLLIDRDSSGVNNHSFEIINDPLQILKPDCKTFDEDVHDEPQTVINCGLIFTKSTHIPHFPYNVVLQINDTTLVGGGHERLIRIPIHLHNSDTISKHLIPTESTTPRLKPKLYLDQDVPIFRSAALYARITQPKKSITNCTSFLFTLTNSSYFKAFGITQTEGIIYVNNPALLKDSPKLVTINVQWFKRNMLQMDEIVVNLLENPSDTCANVEKGKQHCAKFSKSKQCLAACGIATGGSNSVKNRKVGGPMRCMWKDDLESNLLDTPHYNTCTPDIETCPNEICDSLEQLSHLICPQDCTNRVGVPSGVNKKTGHGISAGFGVCTCDNTGYCVCNPKNDNKTKHKKSDELLLVSNETSGNLIPLFTSPSPNLSRRTGLEIATCGTGCLLGILAGGIFLVAAVAAVVACWRFDRVHKMRDKFSDENNDLSAPLSDYVDRGLIPETGFTLNFDMTTSLSQQSANKMTPDSKWEFPRNQLIVEQTLGEGEFGRVLRARAKDIAGQSGYTIVAVKTLKDDARDTELLDLLSEYQLLKEVSHPNVIRLLGASTAPGGPVYLIIEFAQYGSLRSYLRRSRHLKSESQPPISARLEEIPRNDNYDEPKHCKVTPTDILSFAWQISNGMSYLTDIKLVHRDLAARNVLLTENKVCKISDFGLTRDIYEDDAYFKRSKGRVPVKWMAPESLSDHVYTSKSDVWSFGILTWELVTLGATPYPGIQVQNLFHLLKSGYRMERPEHCSTALYKIMRSCWHIDPIQRPTFHELSDKWEKMLSDQVEYLDLTPNAIHNRSYFYSVNENEENLPRTSSKEESDEEDDLEENLHNNHEEPKCSASQKLLEEPELASSSQQGDVSPAKSQGYETPVKITHKATTPSNENPQYYTNMAAFENKNPQQ